MWRVITIILAAVVTVSHGPAFALANTATPTTESSHAALSLLENLPDLPLGKGGAMVSYADLALQAATLGTDTAPGPDDEEGRQRWQQAMRTMTLPQATSQHWSRPEWREAYGFDLFQVEQAVEYGAPPLGVTILRGSFDPDELRTAWTAAGYQPIDLGAGEAYAVREDFQVDVADPGSRMALAYLNVVAIADDGTLIFGSAREIVRQALAATAGEGPSFAGRADIQPLLQAAPADLVSGIFAHGEVLQASPDPVGVMLGDESAEEFAARAAAEQVAAREMPPVVSVFLGQTAGVFAADDATPSVMTSARLVAILAATGPRPAEQGAAVIAERLETERSPAAVGDQPWSELFPERTVMALPEDAAILVELTPAPAVSPFILQSMVFQRAPGFLAWTW